MSGNRFGTHLLLICSIKKIMLLRKNIYNCWYKSKRDQFLNCSVNVDLPIYRGQKALTSWSMLCIYKGFFCFNLNDMNWNTLKYVTQNWRWSKIGNFNVHMKYLTRCYPIELGEKIETSLNKISYDFLELHWYERRKLKS